ncbi:hypothetical protein CDIK_3341 [Cucumispora dikerogammari]|nr:hypothetical protein CDIK_3341 [Cucumispora dikerogammari]
MRIKKHSKFKYLYLQFQKRNRIKKRYKTEIKKIGLIVRRICLNFPNQKLIIDKIIQKRFEISSNLLKNLIQSNTNKKLALLYLDKAFHLIPNMKYKFRLRNYYECEFCEIYETVSFFDYKASFKVFNKEYDIILKSIYEQNLEDIIATLPTVYKNPSFMENINTIYSRFEHQNAVCLYMFGILLIVVFYFYL